MNEFSKEVLDYLNSITSKRAKTVIQHILKHGHITSEEIAELYGYEHPPRAVRDVRERGVTIITYRVTNDEGKNIAAYKFGTPVLARDHAAKQHGRTNFTKKLKQDLIAKYGAKCFIYQVDEDEALLQVDHRIPYEIAGEQDQNNPDNFMLLSPPANRAKSFVCEHCVNWSDKNIAMCRSCFWAYPEDYEHIAGRRQKVLPLTFSTAEEIKDFMKLQKSAGGLPLDQVVKSLIHKYVMDRS